MESDFLENCVNEDSAHHEVSLHILGLNGAILTVDAFKSTGLHLGCKPLEFKEASQGLVASLEYHAAQIHKAFLLSDEPHHREVVSPVVSKQDVATLL